MGYNDVDKLIHNLITIDSNGITIPTFVQIKDSLVEQYKSIWGSDIDTDQTTADGEFIQDEANMIYNIMLALNKLQTQLNANTATGTMLDTCCAFSGVTRQEATASYVDMYVKYIGKDTAGVGFHPNGGSGSNNIQKIVLVDKNKKTWTWSESKTSDGEFITKFVVDEIYQLRFTCDELGPNAAEAGNITYDDNTGDPILIIGQETGFIYQTIDSIIYPFAVWQKSDAVIGQNRESDQSLRSRRLSTRSDYGVSTLSGLKGSLEDLVGIDEAKIYNNNSTTDFTSEDGTKIPAHSVYICLRYSENDILSGEAIDALDENIGKTIYNKLTPGVMTAQTICKNISPIDRSYSYKLLSNVSAIDVRWKLCYPISFDHIEITYKKLNDYNKDICEDEIKRNCKVYARSLSISDDLSIFNLLGYLNNNITQINNKIPYICLEGKIYIDNETTVNILENNDNYFNLDKILVLPTSESSWVKVSLLNHGEDDEKSSISNIQYPDMIAVKRSLNSNPELTLLTTRSDNITVGSWYSTSSSISLKGTQFDGGTTINDIDLDGKIVYYNGNNISETKSYNAPYGGGNIYISINLQKGNYYEFYKSSIQTSTGLIHFYVADELYENYVNVAKFTDTSFLSQISTFKNFSELPLNAKNSIVDENNNYIFDSGSVSDHTIKYVDVKYTFEDDSTPGSTNVKLTIAPNNE